MSAADTVAQMRARREAFALAMQLGVSVSEAKDRLARQRWEAADARLALRRCGTLASPVEQPDADADDDRQLAWWQR